MSRSSAHRLRARLPDTEFDRIWANALTLQFGPAASAIL